MLMEIENGNRFVCFFWSAEHESENIATASSKTQKGSDGNGKVMTRALCDTRSASLSLYYIRTHAVFSSALPYRKNRPMGSTP